MTCETFFQEFLRAAHLPPETPCFDCFHFELSERLANELLQLVLEGKKRATCSSLYEFQQEQRPPQAGDYSVVTDFSGTPHCVIETVAVTILPFSKVDFALAVKEGEDEELASWQRGHRRFFIEEGAELGYAFSEDIPVVFEEFRVVYPLSLQG